MVKKILNQRKKMVNLFQRIKLKDWKLAFLILSSSRKHYILKDLFITLSRKKESVDLLLLDFLMSIFLLIILRLKF